jgi:hypothetical protein
MALTKRAPNTIHLGGQIEKLNEHVAGVAITPGMECEFYDDSGVMKVKPLASTTQVPTGIIALEKLLHNKGVDDTYAINELVILAKFLPGSSFWGLTPSGQNISAGEHMAPNGAGMHISATNAAAGGVAVYQALDAPGLVAATTRVKLQRL